MKKILLSALLAMTAAPVISQAATEVRGNVSMNGSLLPQTCTVNGNGQGSDFTVNMGDVTMSDILNTSPGYVVRTALGSIQIRLTGCSQGGNIPGDNGAVRARFDGGMGTTGLLANTGTGRGVFVNILSANGTSIHVGDDAQVSSNPYVRINGAADSGNGTVTLVYGHRYVRSGGTPTPGTIRSTAQYTIEYE